LECYIDCGRGVGADVNFRKHERGLILSFGASGKHCQQNQNEDEFVPYHDSYTPAHALIIMLTTRK
jgi:hypothetical protein